jgi:DNA-binding MarR family transcriptional regulator
MTKTRTTRTTRSRRPLSFLSPIHKATRQVAVYLEQSHARWGIATAEGHLLAYLLSYGPCPIAELRRVFGHKKSTLTSMLDRLVDRGLAVRELHPEDRRSFLIGLTPAGRRTARQVRSAVEALEREIARRIDEDDLAGFRRVMDAIAAVTAVELRPAASSSQPTSKEKP